MSHPYDDPTRTATPDRPTGDPDATADPGAELGGVAPPARQPADRYELGDEIARGGMGVIYRATDTAFGREVAVKVLQGRFGPATAAARRFAAEARITGQLQHPGLPPVYDWGALPDGRPFLAMKLIKGRTLDDLIEESRGHPGAGSLPSPLEGEGGTSRRDVTGEGNTTSGVPSPGPRDADHPLPQGERVSSRAHAPRSPSLVAAFEGVCQAVGYAHAHGVIHRDLKPANVMVGAFGEVQVMDWGLAKLLASRERERPEPSNDDLTAPGTAIEPLRDESDATQAGSLLGTVGYMPPEQAMGAVDEVDARSDVFGLGAVLCVLLTGRPPYTGGSAEDTRKMAVRAKLDDAYARLDACGADPGLVALCKRCLSAEKAARPSDAGAVAGEVARLRADADDRARRAEVDRAAAAAEAREQRKRRRVQLALAAAVGLLAAGGGAAGWWADRQAGERRAEALRQQVEDERRASAERERLARNADAIADLVARCEECLRRSDPEDADRAAGLLKEIDRRLPEGGGDDLAGRVARCRTDLAMLKELDRIDAYRMSLHEGKEPDTKVIMGMYRAAFAGFGADPDRDPPSESGRRVAESLIRDRLVDALDLCMVQGQFQDLRGAGLRAILGAADPDPYRDAVRDAAVPDNRVRLLELAGRPELLKQSLGFMGLFGGLHLQPAKKREVWEIALRRQPGHLLLLMMMGDSYPVGRRDGADERVRWFQAAVAAHPTDAVAHIKLAYALHDRDDAPSAIWHLREAVRLAPEWVEWHHLLGDWLQKAGDREGAIRHLGKAVDLSPENAGFQGDLVPYR